MISSLTLMNSAHSSVLIADFELLLICTTAYVGIKLCCIHLLLNLYVKVCLLRSNLNVLKFKH